MTGISNLYGVTLASLCISVCLGIQSFTINTIKPVSVVDKRFLSIAIDTNLVRHGWAGFKFNDKVSTLAKGLQPAYLRIGGTAADFLLYDNNASTSSNIQKEYVIFGDPENNFTITGSDLDKVHEIASTAGWDVVFDLNVLLRKNDGSWDPTNPLQIMHYVTDKGYDFVWQLGNEPNHFNKFKYNITASQLAKDFSQLKAILNEDPSLGSMLVGPDVDTLQCQKSRDYLSKFLENGGNVVNAVTWHQYYVNGRACSFEDFYNVTVLDSLVSQLIAVRDIVESSTSPKTRPWMGETSSAYGGGKPEMSDRYGSGFMWLDKLGLAARLNQGVVIRQTFYGGRYALLDLKLNPNPDYWLSLLYKRLVSPEVLEVYNGLQMGRILRVYAHCTNHHLSGYSPGAITVIAINIDPSTEATFCLREDLHGLTIDQYLLTPSDGSLTSQFVSLNGKVLNLVDEKTLPSLEPEQISSDRISLPPLTMGYFVIPHANASACKNTFMKV